jgi:hypothetical protein
MSKHAGRRQRWTRQDSRTYSGDFGKVVYQQDGWYSLLDYKTRVPVNADQEVQRRDDQEVQRS